MLFKQVLSPVLFCCLLLGACSKKHQPQAENASTETSENKPVVKKAVKLPVAKVITVDDRAAKRTPDGRFYYDLEGRRYWRNFDDGKYYLYNKNMYSNPAFKPH